MFHKLQRGPLSHGRVLAVGGGEGATMGTWEEKASGGIKWGNSPGGLQGSLHGRGYIGTVARNDGRTRAGESLRQKTGMTGQIRTR